MSVNVSTESISNNVITNLIKVMSIAAQNSPHNLAGIEKLNGSQRYFTGCEFPFFNGVFNEYDNNESEIIDTLEEATQFFTVQQTPFIWWWTEQEEVPTKIKEGLDANGFQFLGDFLGIAAPLDKIELAEIGENIEIGEVTNEKEYQLFLNILCEVFQMSEAIKTDLKAMFSSYGPQGKFRHYLGFYEGEPAATLTSFIDGSVVGLYNGATQTKFQKHGLCSSLADYAVKEAISLGCRHAVSQLMTPGMAKGISEKMGFQTHCRLLPFLKDPRKEPISAENE